MGYGLAVIVLLALCLALYVWRLPPSKAQQEREDRLYAQVFETDLEQRLFIVPEMELDGTRRTYRIPVLPLELIHYLILDYACAAYPCPVALDRFDAEAVLRLLCLGYLVRSDTAYYVTDSGRLVVEERLSGTP